MNNQIRVKTTGSALDTNFDDIAKLLVASNAVIQETNGLAYGQSLIFDVFYQPSDVTVASGVMEGEVTAYTPEWFIKRQDVQTKKVEQLPKAIAGQGVVIKETSLGQYENYFLNSYVIQVDDAWMRVGISNFTQTEDNNPYDLLSTVLYFRV